uniref:hypothetical protein n=1 Tax=Paenibacillus gorillae TaxID=1243662 RepID=UPI0005AB0708
MSKILISILSTIDNQERLDSIYDKFEAEGFQVEIFSDEVNYAFQLTSLVDIVSYLKEQERYSDGIHRISVLSNIRPLLFSWYRCYNTLAQDFIYFDDEYSNHYSSNLQHRSFIEQLSEFNNIDYEDMIDKIFVSINTMSNLTDFLIQNHRFIFFDLIENFDYNNTPSKHKDSKNYYYNKLEYQFNFTDNNNSQNIFITEKQIQDITINSEWIALLKDNAYFALYAIFYIYKMDIAQSLKDSTLT